MNISYLFIDNSWKEESLQLDMMLQIQRCYDYAEFYYTRVLSTWLGEVLPNYE